MNMIDQLAEKWQRYKLIEQNAAAERKEVELQLQQLIDLREEGTSSQETDNYTIKAVGKLTRTLDSDALQANWSKLPQKVKNCVKWKPSVDIASLRDLDPQEERALSQYMTVKPAKPTFTVKPL